MCAFASCLLIHLPWFHNRALTSTDNSGQTDMFLGQHRCPIAPPQLIYQLLWIERMLVGPFWSCACLPVMMAQLDDTVLQSVAVLLVGVWVQVLWLFCVCLCFLCVAWSPLLMHLHGSKTVHWFVHCGFTNLLGLLWLTTNMFLGRRPCRCLIAPPHLTCQLLWAERHIYIGDAVLHSVSVLLVDMWVQVQ